LFYVYASSIIILYYNVVPSAVPSSVEMDVKSSHSILLSWRSLPLEQQNSRIIYYNTVIVETQVLYLENGTVILTGGDDIDHTYNVTGTHTKLIDTLHPNYKYTVKIAAVTFAGIGPFSTPTIAITLEDGMYVFLYNYICSYKQIYMHM